jgi:type I restriction enzyme, S subunit
MNELPEGWTLAPVDDLFEVNPPKPPSDALVSAAPVSFVPMAAVDAASGTITQVEERPFSSVRSGYTAFRDGDVILAKITPCFENGKAGIARDLTNGLGFGSSEFHVFRPTGAVMAAYLFHFIRQQGFRDEAASHMTGTAGQARVPGDYMKKLELPVPPVAEQHRIVAKLEDLLAKVTTTREHLDAVPAILKRFRQSVLAAACSGRLTEDWRASNATVLPAEARLQELREQVGTTTTRRGVPEHVALPESLEVLELPMTWSLVSVADLLRCGGLLDVKDGNHGTNHPKVGEFTSAGIPFITAAQVGNYAIDYDGAPKLSENVLRRLRVGFAKPGDAIFTHKGSVGRAALNTRDCVLTPQTTYYRCNDGILDPQYLVYLFTSPQFYGQAAAVMSQTTRDFVPISEQYRLFVILPPLSEQREIVRRLDHLLRSAEAIERRVADGAKRVVKLPQSILAKAFRGELVPTEAELAAREGREYEPASVLLERIRKEQGPATQGTSRGRRGRRAAEADRRTKKAAPRSVLE